jgi:hypothetical protein
MKRFVPENIDLDKLINNSQVSQIKGFHPDNLLWIMSEITEKPLASSGFAEIHSKRFQAYVHEYKEYLDQLAASGIIERDLSFSHELVKKVRGYKFSDQYSPTIKGIGINYLPIVKKSAKEKDHKLQSCRNNKHLVKWFNPNLTIDYDLAIDYLGTYYSEMKKEQVLLAAREQIIKNTWYEDYSMKYIDLQQCKTKNPYESYKRAFMAVDKIKEQEYCLSTDCTINRFHSIITLMPSDFRNFLSYDGEELVSLDIRNSQAFFSLSLLNEENLSEIISVAQKFNKNNNKSYNRNSKPLANYPSSSIILEESLQRIDNQEIIRYKNLVLSGKIYDYFERIIFDELGITYPSRKALKQEFFRTIYSSNRYFGQPGAAPKRAFQKYFPGIYEYFVQLKKLHPDIIPIVLQRWESYTVLQCITKRISKDYPEVPSFTIHDGIATTSENIDLVSSIICEELKALTGYSPTLKKDEWNLKNLKYYNIWRHNQT